MIQKPFKITPEPFGLDLSESSIKIAKLPKNGRDSVLERFGEVSLKQGLLKDGEIVSAAELSRQVASAVAKVGVENGYVSSALPEQKSFLRVVQLPYAKRGAIHEAVRQGIEAEIPVKLDDLYFDWQVLPSAHKKAKHLDVLVSAAPRKLVDSYVKLFADAGLKPFSLEPESLAIARCLLKGGVSLEPTMIVDLGKNGTNFIIYAGQGVRLTSYSQISGDLISESISRELKIGIEEAETLKKKVGFSGENKKVFEAITPALTDLKEQIEKYLRFYGEHKAHAHSDSRVVSKILLCGGGAKLKGINEYLSSSLGVAAEGADPFINIKKLPSQKGDFIKYAAAIGLALQT